MKAIFKLATLFMAVAICMGMSSCSDNDNVGTPVPDNVLYDFVTMVSTGEDGTVFEFRKNGDSSLITLTAAIKIDETKVKPGQRVIIQYLPSGGQQAYQSGPIDLYGIAIITNGKAEIKPMEEINAIQDGLMTMHTISRSGQYIDVWAEASYNTAPATFGIYVDETTVDNEYPTAYLKFVSDINNINALNKQLYGSFDIKDILDRPTCKGIIINYKSGLFNETVRFDKDGIMAIQPTV